VTTVQGQELVVHVVVAADGPVAEAGHTAARTLWNSCRTELALDTKIGSYDEDPPDPLGSPTAPEALIAARGSSGTGLQQAVLRRMRDVFVLSVVCSPGAGDARGWRELETGWNQVHGTRLPGVLGVVRVLQARLADPAAVLNPAALGPAVGAASGTPGDWSTTGVVRQAAPLGPFAVWEVAGPQPDGDSWDARGERRLVVVAQADRDDQLSAWTWSRGSPELTPFARYLLHAAKLRYQLRIRSTSAGRELPGQVDRAIRPLLLLADDVALTGREPAPGDLAKASTDLVRLQAGELGIADRSSRLRQMQRTVDIAIRNMARHTGSEPLTGLFADDAAVAEWAKQQLDNDVTYLEAARDRARSVSALADQLVQRGMQGRRERFSLALTGVVGAVAMVLAAMQSLKLEFPLPTPLVAGIVTGLGAVALLVPTVLLRLAVPDRPWSAVLVSATAGLFAGTIPWIALSAVAATGGDVPPVAIGVGGCAAAAVAGAATAWFLVRRWPAR
jgi:hypothetical protein